MRNSQILSNENNRFFFAVVDVLHRIWNIFLSLILLYDFEFKFINILLFEIFSASFQEYLILDELFKGSKFDFYYFCLHIFCTNISKYTYWRRFFRSKNSNFCYCLNVKYTFFHSMYNSIITNYSQRSQHLQTQII